MPPPSNQALVDEANLTWEDLCPKSQEYADIYFSREDGPKESRYVFLDSNNIPERLNNQNKRFTIFEAGFGTGLNFLTTLDAWDQCSIQAPQLTFISVEKHPLSVSDLKTSLRPYTQYACDIDTLVKNYPTNTKGSKYIYFRDGKIKLHLIWGDVLEGLGNYPFSVDAWYLDGFNPSTNSSMWTQDVFDLMAKRSNPHATFATFTAAGFVRRGLEKAGFEVQKKKGFGRKREMLKGKLKGSFNTMESFPPLPKWAIENPNLPDMTKYSLTTNESEQEKSYDVLIVGAGIAGINSAIACARKGLSCLIVDKLESAMQGASGQGYLTTYSKLPADWSPETRLAIFMLEFSQSHYKHLQQVANSRSDDEESFWHNCGQLQLDWNEKELKRSQSRNQNFALPPTFARYVDANEASQHAGIKLNKPGWWFPRSGTLHPELFAEFVLSHPLIDHSFGSEIQSIEFEKSTNLWCAHTKNTSFRSTSIILCNSYSTLKLEQTKHLPANTIRGQVTKAQHDKLRSIKCILCGEGYLYQDKSGDLHIGSSYELTEKHTKVLEHIHTSNLEKLERWLPEYGPLPELSDTDISGSAGIRCTTPDYNPIIGPAPIFEEMTCTFAKLRQDRKACDSLYGHYYKNLYLNIGHGSKGLVTSVAAAEHISSLIRNDSSPMSAEMIKMTHPARFIIKHLVQSRI